MPISQYPHPVIDFYYSRHRPYYIEAGEWTQQSMGFRSPFMLCHVLNELGYEAYVTARKQAPNLRTPLLTNSIREKHRVDKRCPIAVYTSTLGNPFQCDVVVRWILQKPGRLDFEQTPEDDGLVFYWHESYANIESPHILYLPTANINIFNRNGTDDSKRCLLYTSRCV